MLTGTALRAAKLDISSVAEASSGQFKISMPSITSFFLPVIRRRWLHGGNCP